MKLKIGVVIAGMVLGCSVAAETSAQVDVVDTIYGLEALFWEQQYQFLPVSPPSEEVYVHPLATVVPVDWKSFPKQFTKRMYAEMDGDGFPVYRVAVYEDAATRDTVFLNAYGTEAYRLSPEEDYDPFA